jgi:hypothetical protein
MHRLLAGIGVIALAGGAALAHHGWGTYDPAKVVTLEGPVLQSKYEFPHGVIVLEGEGKRWTIILAPPSRMGARGLKREDIAVGRKVKAEGYPSKVTDAEMRAERVTVEGRVIEMR